MKSNILFSFTFHIIIFAALFLYRSEPRKFEGYPTVIQVELVQIEPVSFKAPEVEKLKPKQQKVKPQPRKLEGVTVEKKKVEEEPEEQKTFDPSQLPELFRRLPDDRYRLYLIEEGAERLPRHCSNGSPQRVGN